MRWLSVLCSALLLLTNGEAIAQSMGYWGQAPDGIHLQTPGLGYSGQKLDGSNPQRPGLGYWGKSIDGFGPQMPGLGYWGQSLDGLPPLSMRGEPLPSYPAPRYPVVAAPPLCKFVARVGPYHSRIKLYYPSNGINMNNTIVVRNSELQYYNINP